jgi:hypothetical protein
MTTELKEKASEIPAAPRASNNFIEASLKLGGKSEEEASRTGRLDQADEQVEALFAPRYQTSQSPTRFPSSFSTPRKEPSLPKPSV